MNHLTKTASVQTFDQTADQAVREGWAMAETEGEQSFESNKIRHAAELKAAQVEVTHIQGEGDVALQADCQLATPEPTAALVIDNAVDSERSITPWPESAEGWLVHMFG